ncbi:hypothetical protein [Maricaulis sp.]|jgi:hypothetical protein|uniref:hypothetical protein n=2 Tax=Maricaulis TaxID=74317 RepID=UPI002632CFCC|nr:hypothetical protein [Maricaulis sp.]MDF1767897.1 hypothetical protein [Maricaulis sp.]
MPIYNPPPLPAGYHHFRSDLVFFQDERTGQLTQGWVYSIVHWASGETIRSFGEDIVEMVNLVDIRTVLPVFGGAS